MAYPAVPGPVYAFSAWNLNTLFAEAQFISSADRPDGFFALCSAKGVFFHFFGAPRLGDALSFASKMCKEIFHAEVATWTTSTTSSAPATCRAELNYGPSSCQMVQLQAEKTIISMVGTIHPPIESSIAFYLKDCTDLSSGGRCSFALDKAVCSFTVERDGYVDKGVIAQLAELASTRLTKAITILGDAVFVFSACTTFSSTKGLKQFRLSDGPPVTMSSNLLRRIPAAVKDLKNPFVKAISRKVLAAAFKFLIDIKEVPLSQLYLIDLISPSRYISVLEKQLLQKNLLPSVEALYACSFERLDHNSAAELKELRARLEMISEGNRVHAFSCLLTPDIDPVLQEILEKCSIFSYAIMHDALRLRVTGPRPHSTFIETLSNEWTSRRDNLETQGPLFVHQTPFAFTAAQIIGFIDYEQTTNPGPLVLESYTQGDSVSSLAEISSKTLGTIGAFFHYNRKSFALTAGHVFGHIDSLPPAVLFNSELSVAIIELPENESHRSMLLTEAVYSPGFRFPPGTVVSKLGATTGLTQGKLSSYDFHVSELASFGALIKIEWESNSQFSAPGDSGAILYAKEPSMGQFVPIGLHLGSISSSSFAVPMDKVLDDIKILLASSADASSQFELCSKRNCAHPRMKMVHERVIPIREDASTRSVSPASCESESEQDMDSATALYTFGEKKFGFDANGILIEIKSADTTVQAEEGFVISANLLKRIPSALAELDQKSVSMQSRNIFLACYSLLVKVENDMIAKCLIGEAYRETKVNILEELRVLAQAGFYILPEKKSQLKVSLEMLGSLHDYCTSGVPRPKASLYIELAEQELARRSCNTLSDKDHAFRCLFCSPDMDYEVFQILEKCGTHSCDVGVNHVIVRCSPETGGVEGFRTSFLSLWSYEQKKLGCIVREYQSCLAFDGPIVYSLFEYREEEEEKEDIVYACTVNQGSSLQILNPSFKYATVGGFVEWNKEAFLITSGHAFFHLDDEKKRIRNDPHYNGTRNDTLRHLDPRIPFTPPDAEFISVQCRQRLVYVVDANDDVGGVEMDSQIRRETMFQTTGPLSTISGLEGLPALRERLKIKLLSVRIFKHGAVTGFSVGLLGSLGSIKALPKFKNIESRTLMRVDNCNGTEFARPGDSGALCYVEVTGGFLPIGIITYVQQSAAQKTTVTYLRCLRDSLVKLDGLIKDSFCKLKSCTMAELQEPLVLCTQRYHPSPVPNLEFLTPDTPCRNLFGADDWCSAPEYPKYYRQALEQSIITTFPTRVLPYCEDIDRRLGADLQAELAKHWPLLAIASRLPPPVGSLPPPPPTTTAAAAAAAAPAVAPAAAAAADDDDDNDDDDDDDAEPFAWRE